MTLLAGAAEVDITPPFPVDLLGYVRRPLAARSAYEPPSATACVFRDEILELPWSDQGARLLAEFKVPMPLRVHSWDENLQGSDPMGFVSGVITGVAASAAAAAWYMSRSGERYRDQYRVERRLGDIGDQLEARTREIQTSVNAQLADLRSNNGPLDPVKATAAETAAAVEAAETAGDDATTRRTRKSKDAPVE